MDRGRPFMNAKRKKAAITAILLADLAAAEAWPQAPSLTNTENLCRGSIYRSPGHSAVALTRPHAARGNICLQPTAGARSPAQCLTGDFTGEARPFNGAAGQREAGVIPPKFFHLIRETQQ